MDSSSQRVVVILHHPSAHLGAYAPALEAAALAIETVRPAQGDRIPNVDECQAIMTLGGPMSAFDDLSHPWLPAERRLLAEAVDRDIPVWGVCLGAQLLAGALGAAIHRAPAPELGIYEVRRTADGAFDPIAPVLPEACNVLQWHRDTFELPDGATRLAGGADIANQAFSVGSAYGVQFHAEVDLDTVVLWAQHEAFAEDLSERFGSDFVNKVVVETAPWLPEGQLLAGELLTRWIHRFVISTEAVVKPLEVV